MSLGDVISGHPDFIHVSRWLIEAVPIISRYFFIPDSRKLNLRLRVDMNQGGISRIAGTKVRASQLVPQ